MKCMHCGKELVAMTFYVEQGAFGTAGPAVNVNAATTSCIAYSSCYHEPVVEVPDTAGATDGATYRDLAFFRGYVTSDGIPVLIREDL